MTPCPRHPHYTGGAKPDWNCRKCRSIRRAWKNQTPYESVKIYRQKQAGLSELVEPASPELRQRYEPAETWIHHGKTSELHKTVSENIRTLEDLIRVCKIDTSVWQVERYVVNKWEQAAIPRAVGKSKKWRRPSTEPICTPLFQVKAWLKCKAYLVDARKEIEALKEIAKKSIPSRTGGRCMTSSSAYMLEINIPDLHLGKLAWSPETGYADYDSAKAEELFEDALAVLLERTVSYKFSEILLPLGNDILHSDTKFGTTTMGTQLDTDSRYQKNFSRVRDIAIRSIERLRGIAPTRVIMVPGNHDTLSVWHLGDSLECYYHETEGVSIDNSPCLRKYHQFGDVMLMFTHGDKGQLKDYPLLMATEAPSMFGYTTHREAHTGHTHQLKVQELHGVRVRTISALCPPDAWHSEKGFVGNLRSAEAFVWHKEQGLVGTAIYTI